MKQTILHSAETLPNKYYFFGALDRGTIHPGLRGTSNQQQRAHAYEHYLTQALRHPHIVGAHWFQYREQNITGRGDGENYQIGFVDVCDTPYQEIVDASRRIGNRLHELRTAESVVDGYATLTGFQIDKPQ